MIICSHCNHQNPSNTDICIECKSLLKHECLACGFKVHARNNYCGQCGARMPQYCQECNSIVPERNKFCGECGSSFERTLPADPSGIREPFKTPLPTPNEILAKLRDRIPRPLSEKIDQEALELVGQRREATILYVDIANFATATKNLDGEEVYKIIDSMMRYLVDIVYKYEGTIDKFTGGGLLAIFGLPINHENDPERAVRSAFEMHSVIEPLRVNLTKEFRLDFSIRIGINTGLVIAGSLGSEHHMEYTVIGDTVNLASHLVNIAEPGKTLVGFSTYQRTRPIFDYQELPPIQISGTAELVNAFAPIGVRQEANQLRGLPNVKTEMVGREGAIQKLNNALFKIKKQQSQVVLISGAAGIGKTRLITEFSNANNKNVNIYRGTCASFTRTAPYRVIADILRNIINTTENKPELDQWNALQNELNFVGLDPDEMAPYLQSVLGLQQGNPLDRARLKLLSPDRLQHQIHSVIRSFIQAKTKSAPTIIIFDDLHWVDSASRDFLTYFVKSIEGLSILIVLVARYFDQIIIQPLVTEINNQPEQVTTIQLNPLANSDARHLIDQLISENTTRANLIKEIISRRAGGNPFYVEELIRILIDHGGLARQNGGWIVTGEADTLLDQVPGRLKDIILARFDKLSPDLRKVLQNAAVLGDPFSFNLLRDLVGDSDSAFTATLNELMDRDFFHIARYGVDTGYGFNHPLLRETIYNTILKKDLRNLHLQAARKVEMGDYWLPGDREEILAFHYSESPTPKKALPYLIATGDRASQNFANDTSIEHYRRAMSLLKDADNKPKTSYIHTLIGLGRGLKFIGELEDALKLLDEAVSNILVDHQYISLDDPNLNITLIDGISELADALARSGDLDAAIDKLQTGMELLEPQGRQKHPDHWRKLADRAAWTLFRQGKIQESTELAESALDHAELWKQDDPMILANIYNTLGGIHWMQSNHLEAIQCVQNSLEIYDKLKYHWGLAVAYTNMGILHYSLGRWQIAVDSFYKADDIRREFGYMTERPTNLKNLGEALIGLGDHVQAREKLETSREFSYRLGMNLVAAYAEIGLCRLSIIENNISEASDRLDAAKELLGTPDHEIDDRSAQILFLESLIEGEKGNFDTGIDRAKKAYQIAKQGGYTEEHIDAMRALGTLYHHRGDYPQAEEWLINSRELAQDGNDRYRIGKASYQLGKLYQSQYDPQSSKSKDTNNLATQAFNFASEQFQSLGARYDLYLTLEARAKMPKQL